MSCETDDRGAPYGTVDAKRSFDNVPVQIDWHDYLINRRIPGAAVSADYRMRPMRAQATGLQYRCTTAGVTSKVPDGRIQWPTTVAGTVTDGTVVWTAEAMATSSLRSTISTNDWPAVSGLTLGTESNNDLIYTVNVSGGTDGQDYEVKHQITLVNGELKEGVAVLPVRD